MARPLHATDYGMDNYLIDGQEVVSVTVGILTVGGRKAVRLPLSAKEVESSGGRYRMTDVRWVIPELELIDLELAVGSTITDEDGSAYTVLEVVREPTRVDVEALSRLLEVFDRTVDVERSVASQGPGGALTRKWTARTTGASAAVTELSGEAITDIGKRQGIRVSHRIVFALDVEIGAGDRIVDSDASAAYVVRGWEGKGRIDVLMGVLAEQIR